jgi:adenylate cyclase
LAKLVINPTSATKKEIPIVTRVISIGRDPSNDLVLSDSMVSRRHAILEQRDNQYVLRDNGSSNGTMVNGDRVESEKPLRDGDLVAIGSSRLLFQLDDTAEASIPAAAPVPPAAQAHPASEAEVRCRQCGRVAVEGDRFCRGCGRELTPEKKSVVCAQCGNEVVLPAEFCGRCGKPLPSRVATRPNRRSELERDLVKDGPEDTPVVTPPAPAPRVRPRPPGASAAKRGEAAGFGVRFLAFLIDEMILGIPLLLGGLAWMTSLAFGPSPSLVSAVSVVYSLLCIIYYVYFWGARGATPGKSLLGLTVTTDSGETPIGYGRALLRLVGYVVSSLFFGLGFLLIALSPDGRGLHDRIAGTRVERNS